MNYSKLLAAISAAHERAQAGAAGAVNRHRILRNWLIGATLVEFEQRGEDRAKYGSSLLKRVASDLQTRGIPGCAVRMLERMRVFYLTCPQLRSVISSPAVTLLPATPSREIPAPVVTKLDSGRSAAARAPRPLPAEMLLRLSWTHLIDLLSIDVALDAAALPAGITVEEWV